MDVIELIINYPFFQTLSLVLLHFIWQACAIALGVFVLLKLISNQNAHARYLICIMALILCFLSPCLTYLFLTNNAAAVTLSDNTPLIIPTDLLTTSTLETHFLDYFPLMALFWLFGVIFFSVKLSLGLYYTNQLPRHFCVLPNMQLQELFFDLQHRLKANKHTKLLVSLKVEVPMVIGCFKPVILLPLSMSSGLSLQQIEMLLAHELAHIKRHDYLVNLIQTIVEIIFFFHPAVFWLSTQTRTEREYCCDDLAISCCGTPIAYAKTLTNAELLRPHHIPTLAMAATGGDLVQRVNRMIAQHQCTSNNSVSSSALAGLLMVFTFICFISAQQVLALLHTEQPSAAQTSSSLKQTINDLTLNASLLAEQTNTLKLSQAPNTSALIEVTTQQANNIEKTEQPIATRLLNQKTSIIEELNKTQPIELQHLKTKTTKQIPPHQQVQPLTARTPPTIEIKTTSKINSPKHSALISQQAAKTELITPHVKSTSIADKHKTTINNKITNKQPFIAKEQAPKLIHFVSPEFPKLAVIRTKEPQVKVNFTIDKHGNVTDISFINGRRAFTKAVEKALVQWKFKPRKVNNIAVATKASRSFTFSHDATDDIAELGSRIKRI